jgi:hypothetical protein
LRTRALTEKALQPGVTVQPKLLADDLAAGAAALQTALDATKREEREAQLTLEAKNRAAEAWQQTYQGVGSALYGLYLLAGRKDLAERVMPTARRRSGLPEDWGRGPAWADAPGAACARARQGLAPMNVARNPRWLAHRAKQRRFYFRGCKPRSYPQKASRL